MWSCIFSFLVSLCASVFISEMLLIFASVNTPAALIFVTAVSGALMITFALLAIITVLKKTNPASEKKSAE